MKHPTSQPPLQQSLEVCPAQYLQILATGPDFLCGLGKFAYCCNGDVAIRLLIERELVYSTQNSNRVSCLDEVADGHFFELRPISLFITVTLPLLLFRFEHLRFVVRGRICQFGKDSFGIKELRVKMFRCFVSTADDENLGRNVSGGRWLGCFNFGEQLIEHPEERVVIFGTEDFGNKVSSLYRELLEASHCVLSVCVRHTSQKVGRQFQRLKH